MKPKKQKCEECGDILPEGKEKYVKCKVVCERCYFRLRRNGQKRQELEEVYIKWLAKK